MRTIGIDLAIQGSHTAIVADEGGRYITPVIKLHTRSREIDKLLARAREGAEGCPLQVVPVLARDGAYRHGLVPPGDLPGAPGRGHGLPG